MFGSNGQELLRAYLASGRNTIEVRNLWFSDSKGGDSGLEGSFWRPSLLDHYRIEIDSDVAPINAAILLYQELLESRTSVYVSKYLESGYFTDEFVKNRLEQLDVIKQLAAEIEDNVLLMASIANEPVDWICTFNEYWETGDVRPLILGFFPFLPGNAAKIVNLDNINDTYWLKIAQHARDGHFPKKSVEEVLNMIKQVKEQGDIILDPLDHNRFIIYDKKQRLILVFDGKGGGTFFRPDGKNAFENWLRHWKEGRK